MKEINIAKVLIEKRHEKQITQETFASYMGVSKAAVSKWESGQSFPDITLLPMIATYYNISVDELIDYKPQMTKEEIRRTYQQFRSKFSAEPFEQVMSELENKIKKYYSCLPFLLQMTVLLLNHANASDDPQKVYERALELAKRVKTESENVDDAKEASSMESLVYMMMGQPLLALEQMDESMRPHSQELESLAQAYQMLGEKDKAKKAFQVSMYQSLLNLVADASLYSMLYDDQTDRALDIIDRALQVASLYNVEKLQPNAIVPVYLSAAAIHCMRNEVDEALRMLEEYTRICENEFFPFSLHSDNFFDKLDSWFADFDIGTGAPQGEKYIRQSMLQSVQTYPGFQMLHEHAGYKQIMKRLEKIAGEVD